MEVITSTGCFSSVLFQSCKLIIPPPPALFSVTLQYIWNNRRWEKTARTG